MNGKLFVVLAFFLPSVLFSSCGIPNYFGNEDDYVTFTGTRLEIDDTSNYEDGFDSSEIEPKLMLLYTIYDSTDIYGGIFLSTIEDRLEREFLNEYRLSEYDYRGCSDVSDAVVSVTISDDDSVSHVFSLYQFAPLENLLNNDTDPNETNASPDYLFNDSNTDFKVARQYNISYTKDEISLSDEDYVRVIASVESDGKILSSFALGHKRKMEYFPSNFSDVAKEYEFIHASISPVIAILPVLYLESDEYNNRQMMIGSWQEIEL